MDTKFEIDLHDKVIEKSMKLIEKYFFAQDLKKFALTFINYKLHTKLTNFSRIAATHYDIFRSEHNKEEKITIMTIVELIILASDIMDDLQDGDSSNTPWTNVSLGQNLNIIIGLLIICLEQVEEIKTTEFAKVWIRKKIHQCILESINGQSIDIKNEILLENEYLSMVSLKSGALIKMICTLGTGCQVDETTIRTIETYSCYLGIITQIGNDVNDMLDGFVKNDIFCKKRTLPIIYYLNIQKPKFQIVKDYYLGNQELSISDYSKLHETLIYGGAIEYCKVLEQLYIHKYKKCIDSLNLTNSSKDRLIEVKFKS